MIIEYGQENYWMASGDGPLRPITTFGTTRAEARHNWQWCVEKQQEEIDRQHAIDEAVKTGKIEQLERWAELREDRHA